MEAREIRLETTAGDPFTAAGMDLVPSERDKLLRRLYAREYVEETQRLMAQGCDEPEEEE